MKGIIPSQREFAKFGILLPGIWMKRTIETNNMTSLDQVLDRLWGYEWAQGLESELGWQKGDP